MDIACPQCSTSYALDERLIPPSGTPVRCTRCGHTFTARPPQGNAVVGGPSRVSTQMMGAVSPLPPGPSRVSTQMMGAVSPLPPGARTPTQVMGQVASPWPSAPTPGMGIPSTPPATSTQVMGAVSAPPPATSTQVMGAVSAPPATSTQVMGAVSAPPPDARTSTPMMGLPTVDPGVPFAPPGPRHTAQMGVVLPVMESLDDVAGPVASPTHPRISLPAEADPISSLGMAEGQARSRTVERRGSGGVILVAMLLAMGGLAGWKVFGGRTEEIPAAARTVHDDALRVLRRDDEKSLAQALSRLEGVTRQTRGFTEAHADLALVLTLQLDDLKASADALLAAQSALRMQIESLERAQTPGDWQNRVNALRDELAGHDRRLAAIAGQEGKLKERLAKELEALPAEPAATPPEPRLAVTRARLFAQAIAGSPETLGLMERYQREGGREDWQQLAYATYVLHSPGAQAAGAAQAREGLAAMKAQDASWLRPYMLDARLARVSGAPAATRSNLDSVLTLNPEHSLAESLRALLRVE